MKKSQEISIASPEYRQFIEQLKARVLSARLSATQAVNCGMILLYWDIGQGIVEKQQTLGWGEAVVETVAADLQQAFPAATGFSPRNLRDMKRLYLTYADETIWRQVVAKLPRGAKAGDAEIWPPAAAKLTDERVSEFLRQLVAKIPWGQNLLILNKLSDAAARLYYLQATARFGWSRNVLLNQIKVGAYERAVVEKKTHNFPLALPEYLAEQAEEMMKSSYNLEFGCFWRQLPQRGCVTQPRVAAWPLPWVTINHVVNPTGVASGEGTHYAAIVIVRSYSFGVFNERPRALSAGCGNPKRNARLFGWALEEIGLFSGHRRRRGRSCASLMPIGPDHLTGRVGEGNQTGVQHLDQTTRTRIGGVCVAGRIWRVFSQRIRHRQNARIHNWPTGAPQKANVPRRIQGVSPQTQYGMGRAVCVGMTQPHNANGVDYCSPWLPRSGYHGSSSETSIYPNGVALDTHDSRHDATPLGLGFMHASPQGSGNAATLGYGTESRWDSMRCPTTCRRRAGGSSRKERPMTQYFYHYQPPTPTKELLLEFWKLERGAEKMLEGLVSQ